jgi:hypothetical protein
VTPPAGPRVRRRAQLARRRVFPRRPSPVTRVRQGPAGGPPATTHWRSGERLRRTRRRPPHPSALPSPAGPAGPAKRKRVGDPPRSIGIRMT